jgi:hypothetical protein
MAVWHDQVARAYAPQELVTYGDWEIGSLSSFLD